VEFEDQRACDYPGCDEPGVVEAAGAMLEPDLTLATASVESLEFRPFRLCIEHADGLAVLPVLVRLDYPDGRVVLPGEKTQ
jgi:hypothetical protein